MRYVHRHEFFGGMIYDKKDKEYLHLDPLASAVLLDPTRRFTQNELQTFDADESDVDDVLADLRERNALGATHFLGNDPVPGMLSAPTRIFFEITYRCPEKCRHCYTDSGAKNEGELSQGEKLSIVDQMVEMGCFRVSIAGGEPLVDRDFFPFVEYALERGVDVSFSTSGTPITKAIASRLAALDIRTINISLDGWDEESYGIVRGRGRFKFMVRGVRLLREYYAGKLAAKCTLMTSNLRNLDRIIAQAHELGFDVVKFNCVREAGRSATSPALIPTQDEYLESIQLLAKVFNDGTSPVKMVLPVNPYQRVTDDDPDFVGELGFGCYAGKESFCINPIGEIQACSSFPKGMYVDGNVRDVRLRDAWMHGAGMLTFRGMQGSEDCQTCPSYSGCRGGCYLRSFMATGDPNATDPYCYERRNTDDYRREGVPIALIKRSASGELVAVGNSR
jgi:radical SAM protein with 4Fe4S-binding SPASM domain